MLQHTNLKVKLQKQKKIKINGFKFTIKQINPLLDFEFDNIPQIFTSFTQKQSVDYRRDDVILKQMMVIVEAGLISPDLVPVGKGEKKGKEDGITIEDIFRDMEIANKLFREIMFHSLNKFRGLKSLFFSLKIRLLYCINFVKLTKYSRRNSPFLKMN